MKTEQMPDAVYILYETYGAANNLNLHLRKISMIQQMLSEIPLNEVKIIFDYVMSIRQSMENRNDHQ